MVLDTNAVAAADSDDADEILEKGHYEKQEDTLCPFHDGDHT